ncbi:MAG: MBL fold metallo-hydrolase [Phycisphaerae bacterium]|nr:MBL fold metallo-hydrolase [Phycisphaerae bacterium]
MALGVEKSYLVQKFAKLQFGAPAAFSLIGYSVAGEETVVQIPELNVCFDIGRSPYFALTSDFVCLTHSHMDHIAGLGYYLSQRHFQGMKAGTIFLPAELERNVDLLLRAWRDVERQGTPYELIPMQPGELHEVRRDFGIRAVRTHHGGPSLGYVLISIREKLKAEYVGIPGPELAKMRREGTEIQYRLEVPMVAFLGDTTAGSPPSRPSDENVFDHPDVQNAQVLITELTFFDPEHRTKAKAGRHLHLDHFVELLPRLKNELIVLSHVTRRIGIRRAKYLLRKRIGDEAMKRIIFLMDLDDAKEAGDVESIGPNPMNAPE